MEDFLDLFSAITLSVILVCITVIVTGLLEKFTNRNVQEETASLPQRKRGRNLFF